MGCAFSFQLSGWASGALGCTTRTAAATPGILEGIRQTLMQRHVLARVRRIWWGKLQTVCLENHSWDWDADAVVPGLIIRRGVYVIANARHDVAGQRTLLNLVRAPDCVEIDL